GIMVSPAASFAKRRNPMQFLRHFLRTCIRGFLFLYVSLCVTHTSLVYGQTSQAILVDGEGPWRDDRWIFTLNQFASILSDAGFTINTVAPTDVPAAIATGDVFLAAPSLESLPIDTFSAISRFLLSGGSVMASGGEPFRSPLYLGPNNVWLD